MMRLDRFLCETGFGTRSQVKELLKKGQVLVNGQAAKRPEQKIEEGKDVVLCGGKQAVYAPAVYLMLYKPAGTVSATEDAKERTVLELLDTGDRRDLFPVGRLDKDSEGLLLLTSDGELAHRLLSPKKHVDKVYYARVEGRVAEEHAERFAAGLDIGEKAPTLPAALEILKSGEISEVRVTVREGKFHQVKRMFAAVGCRVIYLKRLRMGTLALDETLKAGEYRRLTEDEIWDLKRLTGQAERPE